MSASVGNFTGSMPDSTVHLGLPWHLSKLAGRPPWKLSNLSLPGSPSPSASRLEAKHAEIPYVLMTFDSQISHNQKY